MLETLLVMFVACLLFFGLFQTALVFQADEVLHHSAARAARARSVGFNEWMVTKAQRVAALVGVMALMALLLVTVRETSGRVLDLVASEYP